MQPIRPPSRETLQRPSRLVPFLFFSSPLSSDKTIPGFISLWKLAFGGRRAENKSFEYTLLMFISALSLRVGREGEGQREEERIVRLTGLALCVMNGPVTDADRFVFNTCGCTIRSASRDKLEAFIYLFI